MGGLKGLEMPGSNLEAEPGVKDSEDGIRRATVKPQQCFRHCQSLCNSVSAALNLGHLPNIEVRNAFVTESVELAPASALFAMSSETSL